MTLLQSLRRLAISDMVRPVARPVYRRIIRAQLGVHELAHHVRRTPETGPEQLADITAVVKTFERPRMLERLLRSIPRVHPSLKVIVVDDSKHPAEAPGATLIRLPFDQGISAGRQAGLDAVETSRLLMLDDDYVFYRGTDLLAASAVLDQHPEIDLVGGAVVHMPLHTVTDYGRFHALSDATPTFPVGHVIGGRPVRSKTANFFLARTDSLRRVGWRPNLKRAEHHDFFVRAFGLLTCVEEPRMRVLHANTPFASQYMQYRTGSIDAALDRADLPLRAYSES